MLTETFQSIASSARRVFLNWRSMLLLAIVYASLLVALYFFVLVKEASLVQVALTAVLAVAAPILFFVLQAMVANVVSDSSESEALGNLLKKSLASFWKLILISLPLIALAVLAAYLLGKAQNYFGASVTPADLPRPPRGREAQPLIDWKAALVSSVRYLVFGLVLPLAAIHLWLATVREGLSGALRKLIQHLAHAFSPQSVLIYVAGFLVFALIPYLLLFRTTPSKYAWLEIALFVARLAAVFAMTLFGWVITVRALSLISSELRPAPADKAA